MRISHSRPLPGRQCLPGTACLSACHFSPKPPNFQNLPGTAVRGTAALRPLVRAPVRLPPHRDLSPVAEQEVGSETSGCLSLSTLTVNSVTFGPEESPRPQKPPPSSSSGFATRGPGELSEAFAEGLFPVVTGEGRIHQAFERESCSGSLSDFPVFPPTKLRLREAPQEPPADFPVTG